MYSRPFERNAVSVGVYKTDVEDRSAAKNILDAIRQHFPDCDVSFDLEDCDNVLRIECSVNKIDESKITNILGTYGYKMEWLS